MKFNINDKVKAELTDYGIEILKKKYSSLSFYRFDEKTKILDEQLWVVMRIFGKYLYNGGKQIFVGNIFEFDKKGFE